MRTSRLTAAAGAVALSAVAVLGGAAPASAANSHILDSDIGVELEGDYPDDWFTGNPQPATPVESTEAGLVLTGKVQLLNGGLQEDVDLSDLVDRAAVVAEGDWFFQIPVFLDNGGENLGFTTFRPAVAGTVSTETEWISSQSVGGLTAHEPVPFDEIEAAFDDGADPVVLAHGVFVDTGATATLESVTWDGDTSFFTPIEFNDIAGNTFEDEIEWLLETGITTGYVNDDGTSSYLGSDAVLREQMAAFLYRFANGDNNPPPVEGPSDFLDVPTNHVFKAHIAWLAGQEITTGYDDGTFRPGQPVLREQMAAFLYRLAGEPDFTAPTTSPFADLSTSHTFYKQITWLADQDITTGYVEGGVTTFRGSQPVLREQMAAFLFRFNNTVEPPLG